MCMVLMKNGMSKMKKARPSDKKTTGEKQTKNRRASDKEFGWNRFLILMLMSSLALYLFQGVRLGDHVLKMMYLAVGCLLLVLGSVSYTKIHEPRLYFISVYMGLVSCVWSILLPSSGLDIVVWAILIGLAICTVFPAEPNYRALRFWLFGAIVCVLVPMTLQYLLHWPKQFLLPNNAMYGFLLLAACSFLIGVWRFSKSMYFGGGWVALLFSITTLTILFENSQSFNDIYAGQLKQVFLYPLVSLVIFVVWHWWSRLHHQIAYDPLLQIYNREYCQKIIAQKNKLYLASPFSLAMVDIDHFKNVNDTYGHQAGDHVLYEVAQSVHRLVGSAGVVCRYGGEELLVFLPKVSAKQASDLMEKVRVGIEKKVIALGKKSLKITVSSGVAQREIRSQTVSDLIEIADQALYRAKKGGRNQVRVGRRKN